MPTPKQHLNNAAKQKAYRVRQAEERKQEQAGKGLPRAAQIASMPSSRRWSAQIELARTALTIVREEMTNYYSDRSDDWQESDKGADFQERVESIEELLQHFDALAW